MCSVTKGFKSELGRSSASGGLISVELIMGEVAFGEPPLRAVKGAIISAHKRLVAN